MATLFQIPFSIQKHISGYTDYCVDTYGNVRSLKSNITLRLNSNLRGYKSVALCKDGNKRRFLLHRLVATAFLNKPEGCEYVDHIDNNVENNTVYNLKWCTQSYNVKKSYDLGRAVPPRAMLGMSGKKHPRSKPIAGYDESGNQVVYFESYSLARSAGYIPTMYDDKNRKANCKCKGLTFKFL